MPNHTDIAAKLRQHSPGCLPESINDDLTFNEWDGGGVAKCQLPDDIAEAVLRDAMVMDAGLDCRSHGEYYVRGRTFDFDDHGGSLGACYAAWLFSKGLPHE